MVTTTTTMEPTTYSVRSTDRKRARAIRAESPREAAATFLGRRCGTLQLNCWAADGSQWNFDASVRVGPGPFRWNRDAIKSIHVFVYLEA